MTIASRNNCAAANTRDSIDHILLESWKERRQAGWVTNWEEAAKYLLYDFFMWGENGRLEPTHVRDFCRAPDQMRGDPLRLVSYGSGVQREMVTDEQIKERVEQGNTAVYVESWQSFTLRLEAEKELHDITWKIQDKAGRAEAEAGEMAAWRELNRAPSRVLTWKEAAVWQEQQLAIRVMKLRRLENKPKLHRHGIAP
jgi:hypothetical protein